MISEMKLAGGIIRLGQR